MSTTSQSGSVYTDLNSLDQLKYKLKGDSVADLRLAAQQFEALFIQQMLKTMREAKLSDGAFDSNEGDTYVEMLDKQLSLNLSQGKGIGLTDIIVQQLSHAMGLKADPSAVPVAPQSSRSQAVNQSGLSLESPLKLNNGMDGTQSGANHTNGNPPAATTGHIGTLSGDNTASFSGPESFVKAFWPLAVKASNEIGVAPQVLIAQAALETGWGRYIARQDNGASSHNLFNIKAGASWQGDTVTLATTELKDGAAVKEYAAFRAYDSFNDSFNDYVALIRRNPRYRDALKQASESVNYASALQKAGYATDPDYADKIVQIANGIALKI